MATRYFGQRIRRNEDPRLLTGQALFTDDVNLPNTLHVAFYRSDYAHGKILSIDTEEAKKRPGVIGVYTAEDLGDYWQRGPLLVPPPPIKDIVFNERTQVPLAKDKICHAGEAVVMVVAESRYIAEDAVEDIEVDIDFLDAVVDIEKAMTDESPLVHDDIEKNIAAHVVQEKGSYSSIRDKAHTVISRKFIYDRGTAAAMENRGVVANWDERNQQLTVWDTTQAPIPIRNGLAAMLGLSQSQVRVIAPFIGGGFGPKIMMFYPEEVLIPWVSKQLKRPVKWIEDREENFFSTTHERGQVHEAEIAVAEDGKILGIHDVFVHDAGAYAPYGLTVPINSQCTLLGCYDVPNYYSEFTAVFTNKPIVTPYRGAGRQHGVFVMERLLDLAAQKLGMTPVEIRRKNFIPQDAFPYDNEIIYQDFSPLVYDSGNYEPALKRAVELIEYDKFIKEEQPRLLQEGKRVGIGIVSYVEGTGIGPYEGAKVSIDPSGKVSLVTGIGTQGQGHFTSFAQIVSEVLDVPVEDVRVVTGDTLEFGWGAGTFASRGAVVAGSACHEAALAVKKKIHKLASEILEASEDDLEVSGGNVQVKGVPDTAISLGELAAKANPLRGAVKPGTEPGLEATSYFGPSRGTTASGVHAMIVSVDPETFLVNIERYIVVHDCGRVINPMILDGQIQGGVAQGIGNAFYEQLFFDENGQLLNASFMDYLLPTSLDVPKIEGDHIETPSPLNPLGVKGAGEAGAIPVGALYAQAIENAFHDCNLEILEIPLSPNRLYEIISQNKTKEQI
ncbi:xanthine dehydrogenase family protein molybdopterin-binding subunit [Candidatus Uabimicrobium amorphum]|uniref:Aldehyde dehydrogenase n=1 Tax=Uabimicrobium amorphum TaxID=2596890 RepID=A0A5S9ISS5_UABAM|nr:xanthine dehydrogenase family protein molybdopterin-binding subunit [Candidatus Uabimicrobium amorphum]BBM87439.1 aldehyde dehydrogenase [Candidatus Uabimicrobium amorphum]